MISGIVNEILVHKAGQLWTVSPEATVFEAIELMAEKIRPCDRHMAGIAFTVSILSLMDALFGMPMQDILKQLSVADEVRDSLLSRSGIYGDMLNLAECIEKIDTAGPQLAPLLKKLGLSTEELYALQLAAFEWSDTIAQRAN